jgi:isochorismate hydrolase
MYRSPDLKSYFAENPKEREVLIKEINKLRKKIDSDGIRIS